MEQKLKVIVTGATGMVGEGVLHECLMHPLVESVLVIGRRTCSVLHPKLREIVHSDLYDLSAIEGHLAGYNACFYCLGISSVGMPESEFYKVTYTLTLNFAQTLCRINPDMTFSYVSGAGTDSSEKGKFMWARVKGKTENDLMKLPFKQVLAFRPGYIHPTQGLKNTKTFYKYIKWVYPVASKIFPDSFSTLRQLGLAMIHTATGGREKKVLEVREIIALSNAKLISY